MINNKLFFEIRFEGEVPIELYQELIKCKGKCMVLSRVQE